MSFRKTATLLSLNIVPISNEEEITNEARKCAIESLKVIQNIPTHKSVEHCKRQLGNIESIKHYHNFCNFFTQIYNSNFERNKTDLREVENENLESQNVEIDSEDEQIEEIFDIMRQPSGASEEEEESNSFILVNEEMGEEEEAEELAEKMSVRSIEVKSSAISSPILDFLPEYYSFNQTEASALLATFPEGNTEGIDLSLHRRKISDKLSKMVHKVSEITSPKLRSWIPRSAQPTNSLSPSEEFRCSLAEATSQRDSLIDVYESFQ